MPLLPTLHLPTLTLVVCVVLFTAAATMSLVGATQRTYLGFGWWTAAQWANTVGALCLVLQHHHAWLLPISALLTLQWPLTMLTGMRQFYIRSSFRSPAWVDWALALAGGSAYVAVWHASPQDLGARVASFSFVNVLFYLYAAWQVQAVRHDKDGRHSPYLKAILIFMVAAATVQMPRLFSAMGSWGAPVVDATQIQQPVVLVALVAGVMFSVYMCLLMTYERTELDLRESHRQLRQMANFDLLTHVPHRRHFQELATQALALGTPGSATLMRFDIDRFRLLTIDHGHAAGDEALRLLASSARSLLRSRDLVGRLGGEAFVALLPDTSVTDALHVAERMVRRVDQVCQQHERPPLSLSFGVVQLQSGESLDTAIHRADEALQEARRQGHNQLVHADGQAGQALFSASQPLGLRPR
ncbi:GGDEF domain-containing protein [Aquabacterium sp.]|jgi:diguanylate cyclase (GGDEF)-like protein|uniref:GGDEF domain-containing protein n=1 Tax=Aquabacterium TaxID=92793 RepID=UPI001DFB8784|nr:GGDEF domain-containing protein [Aquabacterium sp.]MBT9610946.1 GGDEF domain-containing protein [Aquabacterium sp.]|tara:strand:- start:107 stop:1351 length:1245 start_codon:yes stop_codon:yes gene_type:complete